LGIADDGRHGVSRIDVVVQQVDYEEPGTGFLVRMP